MEEIVVEDIEAKSGILILAQKHLHWSLVISFIIYIFGVIYFAPTATFIAVISWLLYEVTCFWVCHQKGRSLIWALFFGGLVIFLKNKNT